MPYKVNRTRDRDIATYELHKILNANEKEGYKPIFLELQDGHFYIVSYKALTPVGAPRTAEAIIASLRSAKPLSVGDSIEDRIAQALEKEEATFDPEETMYEPYRQSEGEQGSR